MAGRVNACIENAHRMRMHNDTRAYYTFWRKHASYVGPIRMVTSVVV